VKIFGGKYKPSWTSGGKENCVTGQKCAICFVMKEKYFDWYKILTIFKNI
jgi:hypothetical protein